MRIRRLGWAALLAAALVLYLFENNALTRALLVGLAALPLFSALLLYLPRAECTAALALPQTPERGTETVIRLTLRGRQILLPVSVRVDVENTFTGERAAQTRTLRVRKEAAEMFSLLPRHCGALTVRLKDCRMTDALGLFSRKIPVQAAAEALVLPRSRPMEVTLGESADALQDGVQYAANRPGFDPSETLRIRDYVPGDPIRQIHWKLSEKQDRLLVREFGLPIVDRLLVLIETGALPGAALLPADMDALLDLLASLCQALTAAETPFTLGWQAEGGCSLMLISGQEDAGAAIRAILHTQPGPQTQSVAGACIAAHPTRAFAHTAVLSVCAAPELAQLAQGTHLTLLLPETCAASLEGWPPGAAVLAFSDTTARVEL